MKKNFIILLIVIFNNLFAQESGSVVITEIMYNAGSSETTTATQYIEIANTTGSSVLIQNWTIDDEDTDGPNTLPNITIPAYGIVVICGSTAADFEGHWGTATNYQLIGLGDLSQTMFNLSNSPSATSEIIQLRDNLGNLVDEVNFDDTSPWPADNGTSSIFVDLISSNINATTNNDGANWASSVSGTNGAYTASTVSGAWDGTDVGSPGTVNNSSSLPVELTSFTANVSEKTVQLNWQTATEVDNYGFDVERYVEKEKSGWRKIGFVQGHGNSNSPKDYSFTDGDIQFTGLYKYRLKQVDTDGSFEYSPVVEVQVGTPEKYELAQNYPNPFSKGSGGNPSTVIKYSLPTDGFVQLKVYDILGNEVANLVNENVSAGTHEATFDASGFSSGIYFYTIQTGAFRATKKMMLIK